MDIIKALQSQDFSSLNDYFKGRVKTLVDNKIGVKAEDYKAGLKAHNGDLKAFVEKRQLKKDNVNSTTDFNKEPSDLDKVV